MVRAETFSGLFAVGAREFNGRFRVQDAATALLGAFCSVELLATFEFDREMSKEMSE